MNGTRICSMPECARPHEARGLCRKHYNAWSNNPTFDAPLSPRPTELERFNSKFTPSSDDQCWEWEAGKNSDGYGQFENVLDPKNKTAHRYALFVTVGPPPQAFSDARHLCNNPPCVNPAHPVWGTRKDNMDDQASAGRRKRGSQRTNALLDESKVATIRAALISGRHPRDLAREFGVHENTIYSIKTGRSWRHVA